MSGRISTERIVEYGWDRSTVVVFVAAHSTVPQTLGLSLQRVRRWLD
jgi:hypothetical protein